MSDAAPGLRTSVAIVDESGSTVLWMNGPALAEAPPGTPPTGAPVQSALPAAALLQLPAALAAAAATGEAQYVQASLISTGRGVLYKAAAVYPLPDGTFLVQVEDSFQPAARSSDPAGPRSRGRRR